MYTTTDGVKALTGYDVSLQAVTIAQGIIETFSGRIEGDVESNNDLELLGRATAYQAAYMLTNADSVFEQIGIKSIAQTDGSVILTYENGSPFIAPLALVTLKSLSWKGNRSVRTGPIFDIPHMTLLEWWATW